jgi:predicted ATP-dependent serine protease
MVKRAKKTPLRRRKPPAGVTRLARPLLQGREQDVALVDHLLDRIDRGGSTLVINGEPGIGKSALLAAAKYRAHEGGFLVLGMTGVLAEVHLPFAGLEQALRPLLKNTPLPHE